MTTDTIFDTTAYDLEGHPKLNGHKARNIPVAFDTYDLDHTDAQHMKLAGQLETDQELTLTIRCHVTKRGWNEKLDPDNPDLTRTYRLTITDITTP